MGITGGLGSLTVAWKRSQPDAVKFYTVRVWDVDAGASFDAVTDARRRKSANMFWDNIPDSGGPDSRLTIVGSQYMAVLTAATEGLDPGGCDNGRSAACFASPRCTPAPCCCQAAQCCSCAHCLCSVPPTARAVLGGCQRIAAQRRGHCCGA